jgi:hypothetical protein
MRRLQGGLAFIVAMSLAGCSTWKPITREQIPSTVTERSPTRIRLTQPDDAAFEMRHPTVRGDTLFGTTKTGKAAIAIPLDKIESAAIRQNDRTKTRRVAASIMAFSLIFLVAATSVRSYPIP